MKYLILAFFLFTSCIKQPSTEPTKQSDVPAYKSTWPTPALQAAALNAIASSPALLAATPSDLTSWCPSNSCDKSQLYLEMLSQLASYESDYKATSTYTEAFPDSSGKPQISAGLLQLSIDDGANYGCGFKTLADVEDVQGNLNCGVKILAKWIKADGLISNSASPWRGASRYWSTFRKAGTLAAMRAGTQKVFK